MRDAEEQGKARRDLLVVLLVVGGILAAMLFAFAFVVYMVKFGPWKSGQPSEPDVKAEFVSASWGKHHRGDTIDIVLRLTNSNPTKRYRWAPQHPEFHGRLTDELGNGCRIFGFEADKSIDPGWSLETKIQFERPPANARRLRLVLFAAIFGIGRDTEIEFAIPPGRPAVNPP